MLEQPSPLVVFPSSHISPVSTAPLPHTGPEHTASVHVLFVPHDVPLGSVTWVQPVVALQPSVVHALLSLQLMFRPLHTPFAHLSFTVQLLLSLQAIVLFTCAQPVVALQESSVHPLLTQQLSAAPGWQALFVQVSPTVQTLLSVHGLLLAV